MSVKPRLRARIKRLRAQYGWTQQQLADKLGVHWVTVASWEKKQGNSHASPMARRLIKELEGFTD